MAPYEHTSSSSDSSSDPNAYPHFKCYPEDEPEPEPEPHRPTPLPANARPAVALRTWPGRDSLDLPIKKGMVMHILEEKGEHWLIVQSDRGKEGWVPRAFVQVFSAPRPQDDGPSRPHGPHRAARPSTTTNLWSLWDKDVTDMIASVRAGVPLKTFPKFPEGVHRCSEIGCRIARLSISKQEEENSERLHEIGNQHSRRNREAKAKQEAKQQAGPPSSTASLGICAHDLRLLLRPGNSAYGLDWLKSYRIMWHPDQFSRRCHEDFKADGTKLATEMFSLLGQLMQVEQRVKDQKDMK
ncbi:hypothetical protein K402DRAFT_463508 [Aulographum hederae CBS 113979]|uniref:SH3 domain-containing protein n=1 Tax=Aulographum hederae CBS 113979 TaxID=1176131 RepID=A0A6G1H0L5_9PEZI|nr:hypothetical protein K402DRAFT_463508 [Aulographum hederae CBS 113979]